jgi:hypothetical protein
MQTISIEMRFFFFDIKGGHISLEKIRNMKYRQTCIKRSPLGQRKGGLIGQATS